MKGHVLKKFIILVFSVISLLFNSGCETKEYHLSEILQLPENTTLFTAYNIWYVNPDDIPAKNIQKGTIIPFGTEVKISKIAKDKVTFITIKNNKHYTINFEEEWELMPIETFLPKLFTDKTIEEIETELEPVVFEKLRRGIVDKGMKKSDVIMAYGPPSLLRTPSTKEDTWIYWSDESNTKRVVFKKDTVIAVITLN